MNYAMLVELEALNDIVYDMKSYNKDETIGHHWFDYRTCKTDFELRTNNMATVLGVFQAKHKVILCSVKRRPERYWANHIRFCQGKISKMDSLDARKQKLDELASLLAKDARNNVKWSETKTLAGEFYKLNMEIRSFNQTMRLPDIHRRDIRATLADVC
jgi:hypothetical protein